MVMKITFQDTSKFEMFSLKYESMEIANALLDIYSSFFLLQALKTTPSILDWDILAFLRQIAFVMYVENVYLSAYQKLRI